MKEGRELPSEMEIASFSQRPESEQNNVQEPGSYMGPATVDERRNNESSPVVESSPESTVEKEKSYRCSVITGEEMSERIKFRDKDGYLMTDPRFEDSRFGGRFKYFIPDELNNSLSHKRMGTGGDLFYVIVEDGDKIVAMRELEASPNDKNLLWMKFAAVDEDYRGKHLSTKLTEETMRFAAEHGYTLEATLYSKEGWERLKDNNAKYAAQYGVKLIDKQQKL